MSAQITVAGRLTKDPELRFTNGGKAWATFSVVTSRRFKNATTGEWEEKDTSFWDCKAFGPFAENIAESLLKGSSVIVTGQMHQEEYEKNGETRRVWRVYADDVAVSCKRAVVQTGPGAQQQARQESASRTPARSSFDDSEVPF